jgi:MFS family permease
MASGVYSLVFNLYLVRLGFREDFIGQVSGLSTLAIGLSAIPAGLLADRIGRRRALIIGGLGVPLAYALQATLIQPQAILLFGALAGASVALIVTAQNPFLVENSAPEERPYLFSANFALMTLTGMVGSMAGGQLPRLAAELAQQPLDAAGPFRFALLVGVALFAVAGLPFILLRDDRQAAAAEEAPPGVSMATADIRTRMASFAVVNVLIGIAGGLIIPFFNVFFTKRFALPTETVGLIFGVSSALIGVSTLASPAFSRRAGKVTAILLGQLSVLPFLAIMGLTGNPFLAVAAFWCRNVGINMINPIYASFTMELVPARLRATMAGINSTAWNTTWAIASTIGGAIIVAAGYTPVFLLSMVFYGLTNLVFFLSFRRYRHM